MHDIWSLIAVAVAGSILFFAVYWEVALKRRHRRSSSRRRTSSGHRFSPR